MPGNSLKIAPLLLCSGLCALIYQVAWLRELRLVFGASTPASAAVLAVFMGGLGYGSLVLSRRADGVARPLLLYAKLEAGIAISAALTPALLWAARASYITVGGATALGSIGGTVARLLLSALVLLPPTFLMGGTLPAAARAAIAGDDLGRRSTALLYGSNTLGAVTGAGLSTFVLLEVFGTRLTLWLACLCNLLLAVVARMVDRSLPAAVPSGAAGSGADASDEGASDEGAVAPAAPPPVPAGQTALVLSAAAGVGFVFLLMELTWYRMLSPLLGGSTYTFGLILAVALLGIGLGGLLYGWRRAGASPELPAFALSCALEALFLALPFALGDRVAVLALMLRTAGVVGLTGHALAWTVITALVVLPAAVVAGYQFPLLIALLGRGGRQVGRHVGLAYACNTLGAILGSLCGGFLLLPALGALGCWQLTVWLLAALGIAALLGRPKALRRAGARPGRLGAVLVPAALSLGALVLLHAPLGPTAMWRHSPIGAGRLDDALTRGTRNKLRALQHEQRRAIVWEVDGRESSVALHTLVETSFLLSGKADGTVVSDASTQVMSGLLGAMLHPEPKSAFIIGLGTGCTAGWLGKVETIERVDVVELEPAILEVARYCGPVNRQVLQNPKVEVTIADAREVLLTTDRSYDLIFSEPSNPYRAGIASLFTEELYEAVRARLNPGGIFLQWIQGYEIDAASVRTVYATLGAVFPAVESWQTNEGDLLLLSRRQDQPFEVPHLERRIRQEPFKSALMAVWRTDSVTGVLARYVAAPPLGQALAEQAGPLGVNTDDLNLLEFALARALGRPQDFTIDRLRSIAAARGYSRPRLVGGTVDWAEVQDAYVASGLAEHFDPRPLALPRLTSRQRARSQAFYHWSKGRYRAAITAWERQPEPPRGPLELLVLAQAHATLGSAEARPLIAELGALQPTEAEALRAWLSRAEGDRAATYAALAKTIIAARADPWVSHHLMAKTLPLCYELARQEPSLVKPLFDLLAVPFPVGLQDELRRRVQLDIAMLHEEPALCAAVLKTFEPYVPWERDLLATRQRCYERAGHPRASEAAADLASFLADQGLDLGRELAPDARPGSAPPSAPPAASEAP